MWLLPKIALAAEKVSIMRLKYSYYTLSLCTTGLTVRLGDLVFGSALLEKLRPYRFHVQWTLRFLDDVDDVIDID